MKKIGSKSALIAAVESLADNKLRDGEFTCRQFRESAKQAGKQISQKTAYDHLQKLISEGKLQVRKVCLDGKITNAFSKP
jgi:hypothetical protein